MYHCFSCDARRDSVREPWNCHQCGSDFVDLVQNPIPQEPVQQTASNPFGNHSVPRVQQSQVHGIRCGGGLPPQVQAAPSIPRSSFGQPSIFGPPPSSGGIGGITRTCRRNGSTISSGRYMTAGPSAVPTRRAMVQGRPPMQLQPSGNPFGVARATGGSQTQSLTSLFNALPPMNQRNTPAPVNRGRPQMFVTPDGRIVDQPTVPGVASEAEVQRRRSALTIKKLTEKQKEDPCSICLDDHSDTAAFLPRCQHYFHQACMERWLEQKNSCPLCQELVA
jgi:hypothetical protein